MARQTLRQRRRTSFGPDVDVLEAVEEWLHDHRHTDRLEPDGAGWLHLHRRSKDLPWAEAGRFPSVRAFAAARAIGARHG